MKRIARQSAQKGVVPGFDDVEYKYDAPSCVAALSVHNLEHRPKAGRWHIERWQQIVSNPNGVFNPAHRLYGMWLVDTKKLPKIEYQQLGIIHTGGDIPADTAILCVTNTYAEKPPMQYDEKACIVCDTCGYRLAVNPKILLSGGIKSYHDLMTASCVLSTNCAD